MGKKETADTYAMTDGVSDEKFEDAITEAREEKNLSPGPGAAPASNTG